MTAELEAAKNAPIDDNEDENLWALLR
jgi:hypothetical protein